jgi:hypothetical protein
MRSLIAAILLLLPAATAFCGPGKDQPVMFVARPDIRNNRDPVEFKLPAGWKQVASDNPKYDYFFVRGEEKDTRSFQIYLRALNVADQDAGRWAEDERKAHLGQKAQFVSEIKKIDLGKRKWVRLESLWLARNNYDNKPAALASMQYFSKEKGSNTIVEVAVLGRQDKINEELLVQVRDFLGSIRCGKDTRKKASQK